MAKKILSKSELQGKRHYMRCTVPNHPFRNKYNNTVFEHRLVMEQWLRENEPNHSALVEVNGIKYLKKQWVVHHKNGKKDDNRIENLEVMTIKEHKAYHMYLNKNPRWSGGRIEKHGKILVLCKMHPFCDTNGYLFEHRLVMENYLRECESNHPALFNFKGKLYLRKETIVQNISSDNTDNRIENLLLCFCGAAYTPKNSICRHGRESQIELFNDKNRRMVSRNRSERLKGMGL